VTHPDNIYHERVIRLCELVEGQPIIQDCEFTGCVIRGPAVLALSGSTLENCNLGVNPDEILWELPSPRSKTGAIAAVNCTFDRCQFDGVGFCGPREFVRDIRQSMDAS
jgi:hypothetical protein